MNKQRLKRSAKIFKLINGRDASNDIEQKRYYSHKDVLAALESINCMKTTDCKYYIQIQRNVVALMENMNGSEYYMDRNWLVSVPFGYGEYTLLTAIQMMIIKYYELVQKEM